MHMLRKHLLCLGMQTDVMAHVDEVRLLRCQTLDILQRFINRLMGAMRLGTQGIHNQKPSDRTRHHSYSF